MAKEDLKFEESKFKNPFLEVSTFDILFPKHRMQYLKSIEFYAKKACEMKKITLEADYEKCLLKVSTNEHTRDPYIVLKAYELIQLLGRGVLLENAIKVLEDEYMSEIIPIHMLCASRSIFERRRGRMLNPKILKSLELITKTSILISNKNACIVGDYRGVNEAKNVIIKCFENIHPAFEIKKLIIKKKLCDENKEGDWDRFLPKIKKTHEKKKKVSRKSGEMPGEIMDRKEDIEMQTGEFYTKESNIERLKRKEDARLKREEKRKMKLEKHMVPEE